VTGQFVSVHIDFKKTKKNSKRTEVAATSAVHASPARHNRRRPVRLMCCTLVVDIGRIQRQRCWPVDDICLSVATWPIIWIYRNDAAENVPLFCVVLI
jgi:hypothetical protein